MKILWLMIPATLLLAGSILALVLAAVRRGDFDDWEGPAARHLSDDDSLPERDASTGPQISEPSPEDRGPAQAPEFRAPSPVPSRQEAPSRTRAHGG